MSNNDVAEIQATLKNICVKAAPEQIENKFKTLAQFNVTGAEHQHEYYCRFEIILVS